MTGVPTKVSEKIVPEDHVLQKNQRLRLQRFGMALITYVVVTLTALLVTRLGLGEMSSEQWIAFTMIGLLGNTVFFSLYHTNINLRFSDPSLTREQIVYCALWGMIPLYSLPEARPIVVIFFLPAFSFGMLRLTRRQYLSVVAVVMGLYISMLVLEYYQKRQGFSIQYELFLFTIFGILLTWFALFGGFISNLRQSLREQNIKIQKAHEELEIEIKERKQAQIEKDSLIVDLKDALNEVKTLSGLLSICASCKKIRDGNGYWNQIESYIRDRSDAEFSHCICPECSKKLYPEIFQRKG